MTEDEMLEADRRGLSKRDINALQDVDDCRPSPAALGALCVLYAKLGIKPARIWVMPEIEPKEWR